MKSNETSMTLHHHAPINYYNFVGLIYDGYIYINKKECLMRLESSLIRNVYFKKEKVLTRNYLLLTLGILVFATLLFSAKYVPLQFRIIGYALAVLFSIMAFSINFNSYKIIITTINNNIITTNINVEYKNDALEFVNRIKQNIKPKASMRKAV